jgi:hypothetical protein
VNFTLSQPDAVAVRPEEVLGDDKELWLIRLPRTVKLAQVRAPPAAVGGAGGRGWVVVFVASYFSSTDVSMSFFAVRYPLTGIP